MPLLPRQTAAEEATGRIVRGTHLILDEIPGKLGALAALSSADEADPVLLLRLKAIKGMIARVLADYPR